MILPRRLGFRPTFLAASILPLIGARPLPGRSAAQDTVPCYFTGTGRQCAAALKAVPKSFDALYDLLNSSSVSGKGTFRRSVEGCLDNEPCQHAQIQVNRDMRSFDFKDLPQGTSIVVGAIKWADNATSDREYKIGTQLENSKKGLTAIFVASSIPKPIPSSDGTIVATWTLYSKVPGSDAVRSLKSGNIILCSADHKDKKVDVGFLGCSPDRRAHADMARLGATFDQIRDARHCDASPSLIRNGGAEAICAQQLRDKWAKLVAKVKNGPSPASIARDASAYGDETLDDYWFGCSLGCCSAEF